MTSARDFARFTPGSIDQIIAYEQGELDHEETVALFQNLIDTGLAWQLQGSYGRAAQRLIHTGECTPRKVG